MYFAQIACHLQGKRILLQGGRCFTLRVRGSMCRPVGVE